MLCNRESLVTAEFLRSVVLLKGALFDSGMTTTWWLVGIRDKLGNSTLSWLFYFIERFDIFDYAILPDLKSVTRLRLRVSLFLRPFFEKSSNKSDFYLSPLVFSCSTSKFVVCNTWAFGVGTWGGFVAGGKREVVDGTLFTSI